MKFNARILGQIGVILTAVGTNSSLSAQTSLQRVVSGLSAPVFATAPSADPQRLFLLEQGSAGSANIKVADLSTGTTANYLAISGLSTGGERGLLGLAFHPDFENNGYFYVYVSVPGGGNHATEIRRYQALGTPLLSNQADPASAQTVMRYDQPFSNHNGGWMAFNPNISGSDPQYLYIGSGDGGSAGDPGNRAQDITDQRLGKMLRIDVNGDDFPADPNRNYAIPTSNPFVGTSGDDEIWAYGLRNPWRNSFDRQSGDLWIADVGQNQVEEINHQPADSPGGLNYGWRVQEGTRCNDNSQAGGNPPCGSPQFTNPVYQYLHTGGAFGGNSVTGGYVYRGSIAQFQGHYFFGDFGSNNIWTIDPYAVNVSQSVLNRNSVLPPNVGSISGLSTFGEDAAGELYLGSYNGSFYRVSSTARTAVWNGDAAIGTPGDGVLWGDARNWSRDGLVDTLIVDRDEAVFAAGSSQPQIQLQTPRVVGGVRFEADYTLTGQTLTVLSGNVTVHEGVRATMESELRAETMNSSIRKLGAGTLLVQGMADQTVVLEGQIGGNGTLAYLTAYADTIVAPGTSVGQLTVQNDYRQMADALLRMEVVGTIPVTEHDRLDVGRTAFLQGTLDITTLPGYVDPSVPGTFDPFVLIVAASIDGSFDQVSYDGADLTPAFGVSADGSFVSYAGNGLFRRVDYQATAVTLENYAAIPGDANGDKIVDGTDFNIWNTNKFAHGTDWLAGDFNGDGITDGSDFGIWNAHKFMSVDGALVPEPLSAGWGMVCVLALLARRARDR